MTGEAGDGYGLVVVREKGFRRQPRLIENAQYWCSRRNVPLSIIDHDGFFQSQWGMPEHRIGAFYLPIAEHYDPLTRMPPGCPAIMDFDANLSSNIEQLDLGSLRYAVRNAFGMRIKASRVPEFQVPYVNRPMEDVGAELRDVIIFDVKPFHYMPAQAAILTLIAEIASAHDHICAIAGRPVYLYFSSFMDPEIFMKAIDAFVNESSVYNENTNHLRRIAHAILPPAERLADYHDIMRRCRLFVTEHGDLADIDLIQVGCLGVPILLYKRQPFFRSAGISLQTLAGAEAIEPRIRGLIDQADRQRVRDEWGLARIFAQDRVAPWNADILESLFMKSWDQLWRWATEDVIDARVNAAMDTDLPWGLGLNLDDSA